MNRRVTNVIERAWSNLSRVWNRLSQTGLRSFETLRADLPDEDVGRLRQQIEECLIGKGGEVSARARAAAVGHLYLRLSDRGKRRFLRVLATDFGIDRSQVDSAVAEYKRKDTPERMKAAERHLRRALIPRHLKLLTQFNSLPAGVKFLVDLRADILRFGSSEPGLAGLERDLRGLLASWFDVGFLELKRITWDSPAALLERLIAYEAVHEIASWDDLKRRLDDDRRCFAFFHPRMPDEPLVFVEVALVGEISDNIQTLLDDARALPEPEVADTAVFYSISNTQPGLKGINLGSFLIKRVADKLVGELTSLKTFVTLSPVPGFRRYLDGRLGGGTGRDFPDGETRMRIRNALGKARWHLDPAAEGHLKEPLMRLCAEYLILESRRQGRAPDPVANFHLSNGARVERINWLADTSPKGLEQSAGMMVNYRYELDTIEENHERYRGAGSVAASDAVQGLLPAGAPEPAT